MSMQTNSQDVFTSACICTRGLDVHDLHRRLEKSAADHGNTASSSESRHPADFTPFFPDMMSKYQAVNDGQYSGRPGGN